MDEQNTGGGDAVSDGQIAAATAEPPSSPIKAGVIKALATKEDITDFVNETKDQKAEAAGDLAVETSARRHERSDRYRRAIDQARADRDTARADIDKAYRDRGLASPQDLASPPSEGVPPPAERDGGADDYENRIRSERSHAQFELRAAEFAKQNPDYQDVVQSALSVFEPKEYIADAILKSAHGPQVAYELSLNPEAILQLNDLPTSEAIRCIGIIEGRINAERNFANMNPNPGGVRRQTNAPAPLTPLRGGASPSRSLNDLAQSEDISDFVRSERARKKAKNGG